MDAFLRVTDSANLSNSPSSSFIAEDNASICPLITPSPPTNDLINPPPEPVSPAFSIGEELANKLADVQDDDNPAGDSASSSSSALAEPACTQLLNHRNVYHHITKDEDTAIQETNGKTQALQLTFRNPPEDYFFMSWNWPLIRTVSLYLFLSGLVAMLALVIAMISTLPKVCNPPVEWYQGSVFYEIFPASFNIEKEQVGTFKGISQQCDYIKSLGVKAIRLNSIFNTPNYPEDYENITNLLDIAPVLGTKDDFQKMVRYLDSRNISVILDLPLYPLYKKLPNMVINNKNNETFLVQDHNDIEKALYHWKNLNVKGFYLKGLEHFVDDPNLHTSLRLWKKIIGPEKIFIISHEFVSTMPEEKANIVWNNIDLIDVKLRIEEGVVSITKQIGLIQNSTLFTKRGMPWVHWSLGNVDSNRIANILSPFGNGTLGATILQFILPGTQSLFYGDEIGLRSVKDAENDKQDLKHLHHLTCMPWPNKKSKILPWMPSDQNTFAFDQVNVIAKMIKLRSESPSIYMNSVVKDGENRNTAEVKYSKDDFLVIQRWYPRRKSYVVASNLGIKQMTVDLSTLLYSGEVVVGPTSSSLPNTISFKNISLWPGESVVIVLD
ncbi:unnamed protein product [Brassicogethes aeneus]|uniref:Glycosyl hydrolase family 13 catalytic domain-containing protein n=1 Tax=Brassicogethes aeneus TaxID=1431903 RepID=A0A9P0B3S8_BRAAE|nr:unnamed protein product [Brassicogethes aeneus]